MSLTALKKKIYNCKECTDLPCEVNPIFKFSTQAKILLVGQAPGLKAHNNKLPFSDKSGERLREWLNIDHDHFYNSSEIAVLPMGLCYPGKGKGGDLPPRKNCAPNWFPKVLPYLSQVKLTVLIGKYAQDYFLQQKRSLTENVREYHRFLPKYFPLPHPSPRNQAWIKNNDWFLREVIPELRKIIHNL